MRNPKLGLKQFKIGRAIKRYKKGGMSLAKAAELAGISIREMISIAYAHGLEPKYDESLVESKITPVRPYTPHKSTVSMRYG